MITLKWVKASVECDGCGRGFEVFLDPGDLDVGMDVHDLAREAVMNGNKSATNQPLEIHITSVQHDLALCPKCTTIADNIETPGDKEPSREQIESALEEALANKS